MLILQWRIRQICLASKDCASKPLHNLPHLYRKHCNDGFDETSSILVGHINILMQYHCQPHTPQEKTETFVPPSPQEKHKVGTPLPSGNFMKHYHPPIRKKILCSPPPLEDFFWNSPKATYLWGQEVQW